MAAAALVIGAGISAYSAYSSGQEKQAAYEASAASKRAQAAQVQIGTDRQVELLQRQGELIHGGQVSAYGHSGVEAGHGSPLMQMEQTKANIFEQIQATQAYGQYHQNSILTEGNMDQILGGEAMDAGVLGAVGAGFNGASGYAKSSGALDTPYNSRAGRGNNYDGNL